MHTELRTEREADMSELPWKDVVIIWSFVVLGCLPILLKWVRDGRR